MGSPPGVFGRRSAMKRNVFNHLMVVTALTVAAVLVTGGCAGDPGRDRSSKAVGGLKDTRDELADCRKQVDQTLAALNGLQAAQSDLRPAYDKYKNEVKEMENKAKAVADRAADMRARADEYQKKWQEEMRKVSNPDL